MRTLARSLAGGHLIRSPLVVVSYEYGASVGAEGVCTERLVEALEHAGVPVGAVIADAGGVVRGREADARLPHFPSQPHAVQRAVGALLGVPTHQWPWVLRASRAEVPHGALVYGRASPLWSLLAAQRLARRAGGSFAMHLSDPLPSPWDAGRAASRLARTVAALAREACFVSFTTEEAIAWQEEVCGLSLRGRAALVRNIVPDWPVPASDPPPEADEVLYLGTFGGRRSAEPLVAALRLLRDRRRDGIFLRCVGTDPDSVAAEIERHRAAGFVRLAPRTPDVVRAYRGAAITAVVDADDARPVFLATKTGEALQAGRRVLLVTPAGSPARRLFGGRFRGVQVVPHDAEAIAAGLDALRELSEAEVEAEMPARRAALAPFRGPAVAAALVAALEGADLRDGRARAGPIPGPPDRATGEPMSTAPRTARERALQAWRTVPPLLAVFVPWIVLKQVLAVRLLEGKAHAGMGGILLAATTGLTLLWAPWAFRLRGRALLAALLGLDLALTFVSYGDTLYFRHFRDLTSIASLRYVGHLQDVHGATEHLFRPADVWLALDLAILAAIVVRRPAFALRRVPLPAKAGLLLSLAGAGLVALALSATPRLDQRWEGNAFVAGDLGLVGYHILDAGAFARRLLASTTPSEDELRAARRSFDERFATRAAPAELAGAAVGRNVIVVQLESFQAFPVGMRFGGVPVTPTLDRLAGEAMSFSMFFAQTAQGATSDAEFVMGCSQYPSRTGAVFFEQAGRELPCLPRLLRERGYATHVFHSNRPDFWNRAAMYPGIGYQRFHSDRDFEQDERIGMGLSDESFLRQTARKLEGLPRPFYAFVITLTNHTPFSFEGVPHELPLGELEGTTVGDYLHTIHYTDAALGHFVDRLAGSGLLDESVLVIYGDHGGVSRGNSNLERFLRIPADDERRWVLEEKRVPLLIRLPRGQGGARVDAAPTGEIDLAPTLAGLLGLPPRAGWFQGRDLLRGVTEPMVAFADGSALAADRLFLARDGLGGSRCLAESGELPVSDCDPLRARAAAELALSRRIVEGHLFAALDETPPHDLAASE